MAADKGHGEVVRLLLERDADPNAPFGPERQTSLMSAAALGHLDVVEALLARRADFSACDVNARTIDGTKAKGGRTAMHFAVDRHFNDGLVCPAEVRDKTAVLPQILRILLDAGADPDCGERSSFPSPLCTLLRAGDLRSARLLLERGARTDDPGAQAAAAGDPEATALQLLQRYAPGLAPAAPTPPAALVAPAPTMDASVAPAVADGAFPLAPAAMPAAPAPLAAIVPPVVAREPAVPPPRLPGEAGGGVFGCLTELLGGCCEGLFRGGRGRGGVEAP